jgi:putative hydrolase of the HAD superfamily
VTPRAVLLDALGTLVELRPPAPRLRALLADATGVDVGLEAAERGFEVEIAHYLAHHMRGGDPAGLERLRDECAEVMREAIGDDRLEQAAVRAAMLGALEFEPYPDVAPALTVLRGRGLALVVASNWDCSLPEWLERAGLWELIDGAVSSASVGAAKPAPAVFLAALELAGCGPAEAVHVGDSMANDVGGARAAGIRAVLVDRSGHAPAGVESVTSLAELTSGLLCPTAR